MSWKIVIATLFRIHDAHGHLTDIRSSYRAVRIIDRRHRTRATSRDITRDEVDRAVDQFHRVQTTRTLRRARGVARHFTNLARSYPQVPTSQRSDAGIAIFEAIRIHGLDSDETWQARNNYARLISDYNDQLLDEKERATNARVRLSRMRQYYRELQQLNDRAANVYGNLCDNRAFRRELALYSGSVRRELLAAHLAFEELGRICARIASNIDTARNTLDRYKRELNNAIRENQLQERLASNQYEPTRRDQQAVSSMA